MFHKKCKFCTVFARVMKHARHSLFIIASVFLLFFFFVVFFVVVVVVLRDQITLADILRII